MFSEESENCIIKPVIYFYYFLFPIYFACIQKRKKMCEIIYKRAKKIINAIFNYLKYDVLIN